MEAFPRFYTLGGSNFRDIFIDIVIRTIMTEQYNQTVIIRVYERAVKVE